MTSSLTPTVSKMGFGQAIKSVFGKYATFTGRATRSEFWWFVLFDTLISGVFGAIMMVGFIMTIVANANNGSFAAMSQGYETMIVPTGAPIDSTGLVILIIGGTLLLLWSLATLVPSIALTVRRFHDAGYTGWFWFFSLIPSVGNLVVLVFMLLPSVASDNQWGAAPAPAAK